MARVEGAEKVMAKLRALQLKYGTKKSPSVIVGYTQNYALYVHEASGKMRGKPRHKPHRGKYWDPQGRARPKYLEEPFRALASELTRIVQVAVMRGASFMQGLWLAGLRLQRESQKMVPVDTGALKASAFTARLGGP